MWISRTAGHGGRRGVHALAQVALARRARRARRRRCPGSARSTASSTASAAAWPCPTRGRRRDADHDVGELPARRPAASAAGAARPSGTSAAIAARAASSAPAGARSISTSTFTRISRAAREQHEHGDEERRDRVAARIAGPREQQPDEHGDRARRGRSRNGARSRRARRCRCAATTRHETTRAARVDQRSRRRRRRTRTRRRARDGAWSAASRSIARTPIRMLAAARNAASASAARCSALPWPYWCVTSAGRPATPSARNVSSAATRSVPEWTASETSPRLWAASPTVSLSTTSAAAAPTDDERRAALRRSQLLERPREHVLLGGVERVRRRRRAGAARASRPRPAPRRARSCHGAVVQLGPVEPPAVGRVERVPLGEEVLERPGRRPCRLARGRVRAREREPVARAVEAAPGASSRATIRAR